MLLLLMMALGPVGAVFATLGYERRPVLQVLAAGFLLQLALVPLVEPSGVHTVGPIHLSETLPALVLLATGGALLAWRILGERRAPRLLPAVAALGYMMAGLGIFTIVHGFGLRTQASNAAIIYDTVANEDLHHAVVVAGQPHVLVNTHSLMRDTGSWVRRLPVPDPYLRDDILFADGDSDIEALRASFPDRSFYRMTYHDDDPPVRIEPLD